jgi:hypothetical protein
MVQQIFRGKTQADVNEQFLRWLQNNQAFNIKRHPIRRSDLVMQPVDTAHSPLKILDAYSMLVEFETSGRSL